MLRRDSPTPREHMSERLWMRDRMALLHSVCHHHEFVKTSHRGSHETCSPQVLTEPRSTEDVKNWMNMFRWIVKLIRDEFGIDEKILVRTATLETDMGLSIEQVEQVLEYIAESFQVRFPENTLDEIVKLEEL